MAWTATDNFDSYTAGADLNGGSGGSSWAGNWSAAGALECLTENAPSGMSGKAAKIIYVSGDGGEASRLITSINPTTSGETIVSFQMMAGQANKDGRFTLFNSGVASRAIVRFASDNNIKLVAGTTTTLQAYTENVVYRILMKFGHVSGKVAVSIDGGAYSADHDLIGSSPYTIDAVALTNENVSSSTFWFDDIKDGAPISVTVSPSVLSATFSIPAPVAYIVNSVTTLASLVSATFSLPAVSIIADTITQNTSVSARVLSLTFSLPSVVASTSRWNEKFASQSSTWSNKY